jgi:hypothetical protein
VLNQMLPVCGSVTNPPTGTTTTTLPAACVANTGSDLDAVVCRLSLLRALLQGTPASSLGGKHAARRLKGRVVKALGLVETARKGRRVAKKLKAAARQLDRLERSVRKAMGRGKIQPSLAESIIDLAGSAGVELKRLASSA